MMIKLSINYVSICTWINIKKAYRKDSLKYNTKSVRDSYFFRNLLNIQYSCNKVSVIIKLNIVFKDDSVLLIMSLKLLQNWKNK